MVRQGPGSAAVGSTPVGRSGPQTALGTLALSKSKPNVETVSVCESTAAAGQVCSVPKVVLPSESCTVLPGRSSCTVLRAMTEPSSSVGGADGGLWAAPGPTSRSIVAPPDTWCAGGDGGAIALSTGRVVLAPAAEVMTTCRNGGVGGLPSKAAGVAVLVTRICPGTLAQSSD